MPDTVDARIPLMAGQGVTPLIGANPNALMQLQLNQLRLQQGRQEVAGQNALRQMFGNPSNINSSGQFQPSGQDISRLGQVAPDKAMEVMNHLVTISEHQNRNALVTAKVQEEERNRILGASLGARSVYEKVMKETGDKQRAIRESTEVLQRDLAPVIPTLSQENREKLTSGGIAFDYDRNTRNLIMSPKYRQGLAEEAREKREGYTLTKEIGPDGNPRKIFVAPGKPPLTEGGAETSATGQPIPEKSEEDLYNVKNKDATVIARRGPGGKGFVNNDTGETIQGVLGATKVGAGVKDTEAGANWQILTDPTKKDDQGNPVQYRYNKVTGESTSLDMKPYTPGGAAKMGSGAPAGQQFSDGDVDYWAHVLQAGGHLPPGLARTAAGSQLVQRIMGKIPSLAGDDPGKFIANAATVKADDRSLSNMTKMADAATSFERTASLNFDLALKLSKDAVPTDLGPFFNRWIMEGEKALGDTNVPPYVTAMLTGANEYAKIMSGSTGAQGSTVDSRREAAELFSPYLSKGQIERVVAVAKADMGNRKQSLYGQIDDIKARLHTAGSGEPTATQGQQPAPHLPGGTRGEGDPPRGQRDPTSGSVTPIPDNPITRGEWKSDAQGIYNLRQGDDWQQLPPNAHFRMPGDPPDKARLRP